MQTMKPVSVSDVNFYLKEQFAADGNLKMLLVEGELSNVTLHNSGHIYFTLKDAKSSLRGVMFKGYRISLRFKPENGMQVLVVGDVSMYEKTGMIQLYAQHMYEAGKGSEHIDLEALTEKLREEGLFAEERKKSIPPYPEKIAIVTSPTGAAIEDIVSILTRRYPLVDVSVVPVLVQGDMAAADIEKGLYAADRLEADTIILARGGGASEDLSVFNAENVVRAVAMLTTPVITGVGHETDTTLVDYAADLRAPTPSAAAERAVPDVRDIWQYLSNVENNLSAYMTYKLERYQKDIHQFTATLFNDFQLLQSNTQLLLHTQKTTLAQKMQDVMIRKQDELKNCIADIELKNPLTALIKGFAKVVKDGSTVTVAAQLHKNDRVTLQFIDGTKLARIEE